MHYRKRFCIVPGSKVDLSKVDASINAFEQMLSDNGTHILKFNLHIDAEEQLTRFKQRIDDPARHWRISEGDYAECPYWDAYTDAIQVRNPHRAPTAIPLLPSLPIKEMS